MDGTLAFRPGRQPGPGTSSPTAAAHRIDPVPGGWDVTGPDGARLLLAAGPGQVPEPRAEATPYDIALLDLLTSPAQLGLLRSAGLIAAHTTVVALYTDHRVSSVAELARRCALWQAQPGQDGELITSSGGQHATEVRVADGLPRRALIIGGARSGKSTEAELRLSGAPRVTYLAAGPWGSPTGPDGPADTEWVDRVARHRASRPRWWQTVESLDVAGQLRHTSGALLIDGIGTWLAGIMDEAGLWTTGGERVPGSPPDAIVRSRIDDLVDAWRQTAAQVVAVTDDVGSGLVPAYLAGRVFRDQLGWLNQRLAAESELVLHAIAGRITPLPS